MAKALTKKQLRVKISERLLTTFDGLKVNLNEKKFKKNVKEASKLLMNGVKVKAIKKLPTPVKSSKSAKTVGKVK